MQLATAEHDAAVDCGRGANAYRLANSQVQPIVGRRCPCVEDRPRSTNVKPLEISSCVSGGDRPAERPFV
jgi:hypothetical protein